MGRFRVLGIVILMFICLLTGCGARDSVLPGDREIYVEESVSVIENAIAGNWLSEEGAAGKNDNDDVSLAFPEDRQEVAAQLWRQVNEGLLTIEPQGELLAPEGLVALAQEALFEEDWSALAELAEPLELTEYAYLLESRYPNTPQEIIPGINRVYQYTLGGETFLLFMEDSGGSARYMINNCFQLTQNGLEWLNDQWNTWWDDYVVPYGGSFYLVDGNYDYYTDYPNTVYLHPLTMEGISEDATKVSLVPVEYEWARGYQGGDPRLEQINRYVEGIQEELMKASLPNNIILYTGCEDPVTDPALLQCLPDGDTWHMADYNNDGQVEYLRRRYLYSGNDSLLGLSAERYRIEDTAKKDSPYFSGDCTLMQLWYQEIEGKIYTFQLFLTERYSYFMNVSLYEENRVSRVAGYYVTPRCEWRIDIGRNYTGNG